MMRGDSRVFRRSSEYPHLPVHIDLAKVDIGAGGHSSVAKPLVSDASMGSIPGGCLWAVSPAGIEIFWVTEGNGAGFGIRGSPSGIEIFEKEIEQVSESRLLTDQWQSGRL